MNKHYLSKLARNPDQKKFKCKAVVWLAYKRSVKQPIITCRAVIVNISRGGAMMTSTAADVPEHFYIVIGNYEYAIGCVVVRKESNGFAVEFIKEQPQRIIEAFALLSFPMAPLFSLKGLMRNVMMEAVANEPLTPVG